jgi:hypothetical protein
MRASWLTFSPTRRATRVMDILGIPNELRRPSDLEEMKRLGRAIRRIRPVSKSTLERELNIIREANIPLLVVSGGWSPAFEAMSALVSTTGGGSHQLIPSGHHFPQLMAEPFNALLGAFLLRSEAKKTTPRI